MRALLLESASIAGDPFEPELAFAIAELAPDPGVAALDELLDARLLHPTDVPRRFAFRHPLVRRAVYETSKAGWRLTAHARAAQALAAQGASAATRAHHVEQSGVQGEAAAIALLMRSGRRRAHRAPASAARWYAAALRLMPEASRPERLNALIKLARVQQSTGDLERCIATLARGARARPGRRARDPRPAHVRVRGLRALSSGATSPRSGACSRPSPRCRIRAPPRRWPCCWTSPPARSSPLDTARMCDVAEQALTCARALARPGLLATAAAVAAHSCAVAGRIARARTHADEAGALLDARGDDDLAHLLDAVNRLAWAEHLLERFDDSIRHAGARRRRRPCHRARPVHPRDPRRAGAERATRGDLAVATALQEEALESAQLAANDYVTSSVLTATAHIAMARGELEQAREAAEQSVACVDGIGAGHLAAMAHARLAVTLRALGDTPGKSEQLVAAAGGWDLPLLPPTWGVAYKEALTRIELDAGRLDQARAFADAAVATAAALGLPLTDAIAQRAHASVLLAEGDAETADRRWRSPAPPPPTTQAPRSKRRGHACWPARRWRRRGAQARGRAPAPRRARPRRARSAARPRRRPPSAAATRRAHRAARAGGHRHQRPRFPLAARARDRAPRHRPQDQQGDRRRAVPQRQDRRIAPAQHLRQARRLLPGRCRARDRTSRRSKRRTVTFGRAVPPEFVSGVIVDDPGSSTLFGSLESSGLTNRSSARRGVGRICVVRGHKSWPPPGSRDRFRVHVIDQTGTRSSRSWLTPSLAPRPLGPAATWFAGQFRRPPQSLHPPT